MEFFKCSIAGTMYGTGVTEIQRAAALRCGVPLEEVTHIRSRYFLLKNSKRSMFRTSAFLFVCFNLFWKSFLVGLSLSISLGIWFQLLI